MASKLRVVPDEQPRHLRLLGIVRVSKERDAMISPENQEFKIISCAEANGYVLAPAPNGERFMYGIDESGSQRKSKWWAKLDQAIELVEAGEYDGIIMWKFSRAGRNRLRWNIAVDRIESAGGVLISATEDFDVTTAAGRLGRGISAEFNAFHADMIGEGWVEAHERRVRNGRPHSGRPKWGYVYDRAAKLHVPATVENIDRLLAEDPEFVEAPASGPVLAAMYERYIAGESFYSLARWLNDHGWRTTSDGHWSDDGVRRVLDQGFASGRFMFRKELHPGVHEPLIDEETWQAYLDARGARRQLPARTERSVYLLSGLIRCTRCGGKMVASYVNPGMRLSHRAKGRAEGKMYSAGRPRHVYRCQWGKRTGRCRGGSIRMHIVEEFVRDYVEQLAARIDDETNDREISGHVVDARRRLLLREEQRLDKARDKARAELKQLMKRDAERPYPRDIFDELRGEIEDNIAGLSAAIEAAGRTVRRSAVDPQSEAARLVEEWDELPAVNRREVLRGLIDCVLVGTGEVPYLRVVDWAEVRPETL